MFELKNSDLSVLILDPAGDVRRLGSRYCSGGYIHQVRDAHKGELLSGPQYPIAFPDDFDGQGAPEMFRQALGAETAAVGEDVGCIGVGVVRRTSPIRPFDVRHNREVAGRLQWQVDARQETLTMRTSASFKAWVYRLVRQVNLTGRTIASCTAVRNEGDLPLPVRWFAHPFFPLTKDDVLCRFSIPVTMPENPGYFLNADDYICRKPGHDWEKGWYQALDFEPAGRSLLVVQKHPLVGEVVVETDFLPGFLPVWGNDRTFSFEPFFERELAAGDEVEWSIEYRF
jgi:hypothetical protein